MTFTPRTRRRSVAAAFIVAGAVLASLAIGAAPATADGSPPLTPVQATGDGIEHRAELFALAGKHTLEQISAIVNGGGRGELLVNPETGEVVAAIATTPFGFAPFSSLASNRPRPAADGGPRSAGIGVGGPDYRAQLLALVGKQTPEQIAAIERGGGALQLLVDPNTGAVLAALQEGPAVLAPFSLSIPGE